MIRILTYKNGNLTLNQEELCVYKEFRAIFMLKYNKSEGDSEGTKRYEAFKVCTYMYLYHDWRSPYIDYDDESKKLKCLKEAGYIPTHRFDLAAQAAINKYKELLLEYAPSVNALTNLRKALRLLDRTISIRTQKISELTDKLESLELDVGNSESIENYALVSKLIDQELLNLLPLGDKIKKTYKDIEDLEDIVRKELGSTKTARGGKEVGKRADPDEK